MGLTPGQEVLSLGGQWLTGSSDCSVCECIVEGCYDNEDSLEMVVSRESSESLNLKLMDGVNLGLQLKGNQPVFVNRVDKGEEDYMYIYALYIYVMEEERQRKGGGKEGGETSVHFLEIHFKNLHATTKKNELQAIKILSQFTAHVACSTCLLYIIDY